MNNFYISLKLMEFMAAHRGRENAVPRDRALANIQPFAPKLDDRSFREIYVRQPICSCEDGLFVPVRPLEVKGFYEYLLRQGMSKEKAWERVKIILVYFPHLSWSTDSDKQMDLFGG
jgi:hypothetical protein